MMLKVPRRTRCLHHDVFLDSADHLHVNFGSSRLFRFLRYHGGPDPPREPPAFDKHLHEELPKEPNPWEIICQLHTGEKELLLTLLLLLSGHVINSITIKWSRDLN
jgi:hypothetical protein